MSQRIALTQGEVALVDQGDYCRIKGHSWSVTGRHSTGSLYACSWIDGGKTYMHRFILGNPEGSIDHQNGNGLDNRRSNLRLCNNAQNMCNRVGDKDGSSEYKGVCWHKETQKWRAYIGHDGRQFELGLFQTQKEAALAYDRKCIELHGKFASPNILNCSEDKLST